MNKTKDIIIIALCAAMLIGVQLALSGISGIELVTVLLLCFCFCFGALRGVAIATVFSLLRCFIFGFVLNVVILYLVFYNLFALFFGWLGKHLSDKISIKNTAIVVASALLFTFLFTLFDDVITPLFFGFNKNATIAYIIASLYTLIPHLICNAITVSVLFSPLTSAIRKIAYTQKSVNHT